MSINKRVIVVTGAKGSGKSTALATYPPATEEAMAATVVVDTEDSMNDIYEQYSAAKMPFTLLRAYDRFKADDDLLKAIAAGKLPWVNNAKQKSALVGYYEWFVKTLDETLSKGKYKYLIIDTIEPIEAAMTAWAETNKNLSGWSGTKAYGRLETEAVRPLYENLLEAFTQRGIETILMSSHIKRVWEDDKPILNKVQPGGRMAVLSRLSSMMFWVVQSADSIYGEPAAIVLKARMGLMEAVNGRWQPRRVLPRRIPHFNWSAVDAYIAHPADLTNPAPGEIMTSEEREMVSEMLTDEQMRLMVVGAEIELSALQPPTGMLIQSNPAVAETSTETVEQIKQMIASEKTNDEIRQALSVPLPVIIRARAELKRERKEQDSNEQQ